MLIIEIDGDTHDVDQDAILDEELRMRNNYETMRFTNAEIMQNIIGVYQMIELRNALFSYHCLTPHSYYKEEGI